MKLIVPPPPAITLTEAKQWLRVDHDADDDLIVMLSAAAVAQFDGPTGILSRALEPQTWEHRLDSFRAEIRIPLGPLVSVEAVAFVDPDGVEQTISPSDYEVDTDSPDGWIVPIGAWPATMATPNAVRVRWVAGNGAPLPVKVAALKLLSQFYDARSASSEMPREIMDLVAAFRHSEIAL